MKSLSKLFRIGCGPSSSHTIAPQNATMSFKSLIKNEKFDYVLVTLYGSLALTGKGHGTNQVIEKTLLPYPCRIIFDTQTISHHPNEMKLSLIKEGTEVFFRIYDSLGGGEIYSPDDSAVDEKDIYPFSSFEEIKSHLHRNGNLDLKDFCLEYENKEIDEYLSKALDIMFSSVEKGLVSEGRIPANNNPRLNIFRNAKAINEKAYSVDDPDMKRLLLITSYAYAVSESSACHEEIVTSPTCGSSGILPAILYYEYHDCQVNRRIIKDSLYTAGIFGNIVKQNASISGAIGGCQAEVGTASSMAAAALSYINGLYLYQIEYAAECAMEHFLGLSCDPVDGYVIIPCIERNGMGALRAYNSYAYAKYISGIKKNQVSFDNVVSAMKMTGDSLASAYKETALGGLAKILKEKQ
ncbi:MAG: L-serine ammonia-lyase, iron-sulfur-dependent, subunit alpha [Bacilli bacterium]